MILSNCVVARLLACLNKYVNENENVNINGEFNNVNLSDNVSQDAA